MSKFSIEEKQVTSHFLYLYGQSISSETVTNYNIIRLSDNKIVKTLYDYLEALKYLEALEERSWLVS